MSKTNTLRRWLSPLAAALLLFPVLAACAPQAPAAPTQAPPAAPATQPAAGAPTTAPAPGTPAGQVRRGGTVTEVGFGDIKTLNPVLVDDTASDNISSKIFESMVDVDPKTGEPIPWVAESWNISQDGLTYTFKLRRNVTWSDGKPLTANDVKFTWETILDPKTETVRKNIFDRIVGAKERIAGTAPETTGIRVVDDYTLEVKLTEPYCPFLLNGGGFDIIPKHILEGQDINTAAFNTQTPVGSGPWKFKEWMKGSHVTLVRNENYWGGPDGKVKGGPNLDTYIYKVVADQTAILNNLKTGESDVGKIQPKDRDELAQVPHMDLERWQGLSYTYIGYNLRKPVLQDVAVRKALAMAIDPKPIIDQVLNGEGVPLASHMPPTSWAYNPAVQPVKFDPEAAKKMLEDAGWRVGADGIRTKGDQRLKFTLWTNAGNKTREAVATVAQQQWREIGVELDIQFEEWSAFLDRLLKTFDFDMVIVGWSLGVDPNPEGIWHSKQIATAERRGNNFGAYSNPEIDRLIDQGNTVAGCAKEERKRIYADFQRILANDQPYIWLFLQNTLAGFHKRIQGEAPTPFVGSGPDASWNAYEWSLTQ